MLRCSKSDVPWEAESTHIERTDPADGATGSDEVVNFKCKYSN